MNPQNHHFVLVPLMAQGHMVPIMDLARLIAERGALVSVITTPVNAAGIKDATNRLSLPIRLVELQFPCTEVGLPAGCENLHVLPSFHLLADFFHACRLLAPQLESFLIQQQATPTCIITDFCHPWTKAVADKLRIPRLISCPNSCFFLLCSHIIHANNLNSIPDDMEPFLIPDLPVHIRVTRAQAPAFGGPGADYQAVLSAIETAHGVVVNSFEELEPWVFELYREAVSKKVWGVGPLSLCNKDLATMALRGSNPAVDTGDVLCWLDTMKESSVVYFCLGSSIIMPPGQLIEIGLGLEAAGRPFIWVIKDEDSTSTEIEKWVDDLKHRTKQRSLIIKGWAPQAAILSHRAIGGLVSHAGWNSVLEGISEGLQMVTWPHFGDQFLNQSLVVEILGIGVPIQGALPIGVAGREVVGWEEVERAVRALMDDGDEAEGRREKARVYGESAKKAMEDGGSSYRNVTDIIEFVSKLSA